MALAVYSYYYKEAERLNVRYFLEGSNKSYMDFSNKNEAKDALPLILFFAFLFGLWRWINKHRLVAFSLDETRQVCIFETYSFWNGNQIIELPLSGVGVSIFQSFFDRIFYGSPVFFTLREKGLELKASGTEGFSTIVMEELQQYLYKQTILVV